MKERSKEFAKSQWGVPRDFSLKLRSLSKLGGFIVNFEVSVKCVVLSLHN